MRWTIAPEAISLVILSIIWINSRKGSHIPSMKNKMFQGCLMITFSAMLSNILSTLMIYRYDTVPLWMTWIVTMIYFVLTPLMGLVYYLYVISVIFSRYVVKKQVIVAGLIPGVIYLLFVLMNPWGKYLFDINMEQGYVRGSLIVLTYVVFYIYCLASIIVTIWNRKRMDSKIYRILSAFPVLAVLVIIVQQMYPDTILSGSAATCALLIVYLHLQNRQFSMDYLTNVPNRQELLNMLDLRINKYPGTPFTLLVLSLCEFRQINNTCGQETGDQFLKEVCSFLCSLEPGRNVYRFSGDEFAVLFMTEGDHEIKHYIETVLKRMEQPWQVANFCFHLSAVLGVIRQQDGKKTLEETVNAIEYAVNQAKSGKYGKVCYCDKEMLETLKRKQKIVEVLKDKLENQSFEMFYQPIYSVKTGTFMYAESLMRINESSIGPIYPSEFIPIAEETGLIIEFTYVILDKVCRFINRLISAGVPIGAVHVNFTAIQFTQPGLPDKVLEIIRKNGTPPSAVKIEFTESTLAENPQSVRDFAMEMKKQKIVIGLDDYGTGYSNFEMVMNIPFNTVKLDRGLIWSAMKNKKSERGVSNIVRTFKELGMTVIAEGVETEEQKQMVIECGVDQIQGFYYSKPLSAEDAEKFLKQRNAKKHQKNISKENDNYGLQEIFEELPG